jgi:hypothetical protein
LAGGQPVSLANLRVLRDWCTRHGVLLVHDMTRVAENAYFIQQREAGYASRSVASIVHEICSLTDAATMSAKKDALVNIGGFLAMNDPDLYRRACDMIVIYEGLHTYLSDRLLAPGRSQGTFPARRAAARGGTEAALMRRHRAAGVDATAGGAGDTSTSRHVGVVVGR